MKQLTEQELRNMLAKAVAEGVDTEFNIARAVTEDEVHEQMQRRSDFIEQLIQSV